MITLLLATGLALASPHPSPRPYGMEAMALGDPAPDRAVELFARFPEIAERLGLSEEQKTQVRDLLYAHRAAELEVEPRADRAELELRHLLSAAQPDEKAIFKALDTLIAAEADMKRLRMKSLLSLRRIITAEQWEQIQVLRAERREERRERWSGGDDD